jgi:hypothetical protein
MRWRQDAAINDCRSCGRSYWRYDSEFPPRGYCSVACKETGSRHSAHPSAFAGIAFIAGVLLVVAAWDELGRYLRGGAA